MSAQSGSSSAHVSGPAAGRHRLGNELRRLRQTQSLRLEDVATSLDIVPSTLSRIETGQASTKPGYLAAMLDLYHVDDQAQRDQLTNLARDGHRSDGWADGSRFLPAGAGRYLHLEAAASHVRSYAVHAIPGLLQTSTYAAACLRAAQPGLSPSQVRKLVALQVRRQELAFNRGQWVHLVIDESALLRSIGARVMLGQLRHLAAMATDPAVTLQVAELGTARPTLTPAFAVLSFADPAESDVACGSGIGGHIVITGRRGEVQAAQDAFSGLTSVVASPEDSATLIKSTIAYWERQVSNDR